MAEDPLSVIEERMKLIENKVFGQSNVIPDIPIPIVESLLESQKIISSALSGREKMAAALKRLDQLETVLDPMYEDYVIDTSAKLAFVLSMEQELEEITGQLIRVSELSQCFESGNLRNTSQLVNQMSKLTSTLVEHRQKYSLMDDKIDDLVTKYTEITTGVTAVLATLTRMVEDLEIKAQPKQLAD